MIIRKAFPIRRRAGETAAGRFHAAEPFFPLGACELREEGEASFSAAPDWRRTMSHVTVVHRAFSLICRVFSLFLCDYSRATVSTRYPPEELVHEILSRLSCREGAFLVFGGVTRQRSLPGVLLAATSGVCSLAGGLLSDYVVVVRTDWQSIVRLFFSNETATGASPSVCDVWLSMLRPGSFFSGRSPAGRGALVSSTFSQLRFGVFLSRVQVAPLALIRKLLGSSEAERLGIAVLLSILVECLRRMIPFPPSLFLHGS